MSRGQPLPPSLSLPLLLLCLRRGGQRAVGHLQNGSSHSSRLSCPASQVRLWRASHSHPCQGARIPSPALLPAASQAIASSALFSPGTLQAPLGRKVGWAGGVWQMEWHSPEEEVWGEIGGSGSAGSPDPGQVSDIHPDLTVSPGR